MTPVEALAQIAQSAQLNQNATVLGLGRLAWAALRDSGEHGLLFVVPGRDVRTITCYCVGNVEPRSRTCSILKTRCT